MEAGNRADYYSILCMQLKSLSEGVSFDITNLSNASALLFGYLTEINWAGFYLVKDGDLLLGPFQGKPACVRIPFGRGVCGTAAEKDQTVVVGNVHDFPGHIACDSTSESEIVIPIHVDGKLYGVLDIDSPVRERFSEDDRIGLEQFVAVLEEILQNEAPPELGDRDIYETPIGPVCMSKAEHDAYLEEREMRSGK